jgi:dolichol kinase
MDLEIKRQIVHAMGVFNILLIHLLNKTYAAVLMFLIAVAFLFLGEYRKNKEKYKLVRSKKLDEFEDVIEDEFKTYERKKELPFHGAITFFFGSFLATILFDSYIAIASIAVLALADSLSTLVGYYFGKHKLPINKNKSWEGSTIFFLSALAVLYFFADPAKALVIAVAVTFVETLPKIDDNLTVPISTGLLMFLL